MSEAAATTTAATTTAAATTETTAATTTAATTAAPAWHGLTDAEATAYVTNKGWSTPADVIKSYQGAEKLIGKNPDSLLVMPRADDPAGLRAVLGKLGLPETADKYEFAKPPEGLSADASYEAFARGTFHKIGLLPGQVKDLTAAHNEYVAGVVKQQAKDYEVKVTTEKASLLKEWGGGHERMMAAAKSAAGALGFTGEMIDAMESAVGYAGTYKFFAALGQKMGEDGFVIGGDKSSKFGTSLTPAEAKVEYDSMRADPIMAKALVDRSHPQHAQAKEKQTRLFGIMYPA